MIEGIKVRLSTEKLKAHFKEREAFHLSRVTFFKSQAEKFENEIEQQPAHSNRSVQEPREKFIRLSRQHDQKAGYFKVLRENLIENEMFLLTTSELVEIEMLHSVEMGFY